MILALDDSVSRNNFLRLEPIKPFLSIVQFCMDRTHQICPKDCFGSAALFFHFSLFIVPWQRPLRFTHEKFGFLDC